jgi:DNA helicase-2/ATP-dependent DNA helicase PcrA
MQRVYEGYERRKRTTRRLDFEDMLGLALHLFDEHPEAAEIVQERFHAFTVDEYQDVNPLQAGLLERWLGGRDDLCVVGDDYQTIYAFTGASPEHLLSFTERFPAATVVRLEDNYRSTPEVLELANRLAPHLGGFRKTLRATRASGPPTVARAARRLHDEEGVPFEEIAVLYRINARSEPFEEAFAAAGIPYQVRDAAFLRRPGPRAVLVRLRRAATENVARAVEQATDAVGFDPGSEADDAEEVTRQADLARLRALAGEHAAAHPDGDVAGFVAELERRFSADRAGRGVNLSTLHRAKGLEFDAVFLPRLLDRELPFRSGRATADPDEERRLLYVGITRARHHLYLSWPSEPRSQPSPFLAELGVTSAVPGPAGARARTPVPAAAGGPLFDRLREWRRERAKTDGVPAYVVFHDATLAAIARDRPPNRAALASVAGVGPTKLERYADEVLEIVAAAG